MEAASSVDVRAQRRNCCAVTFSTRVRICRLERGRDHARAEQQPGPVDFLEGLEVEQVDAPARLEQVEPLGQPLRRAARRARPSQKSPVRPRPRGSARW
jgi:hypothetical protein